MALAFAWIVAFGCGGDASKVSAPVTATRNTPTPRSSISPADTCTTVSQLVEIDKKFDPLLRKYPKKPSKEELLTFADDLSATYVEIQHELDGVSTVIADDSVTEGRRFLEQSLDLAVRSWSDLAESIRTEDTGLARQAATEFQDSNRIYRDFVDDVYALSACF